MPVLRGCCSHCQKGRSLEHHALKEDVQPADAPLYKG